MDLTKREQKHLDLMRKDFFVTEPFPCWACGRAVIALKAKEPRRWWCYLDAMHLLDRQGLCLRKTIDGRAPIASFGDLEPQELTYA